MSIYEESAKLLYKEIDYMNEAANAVRFQENFEGNPWVKVQSTVCPPRLKQRVCMCDVCD